ncbi:MAG: type II toxin-antitoxin system HicB family antitoxin [Methylocella sp.]
MPKSAGLRHFSIEQHSDDYLAYFPALEGYDTWGKTYEEAIKHAEEALTLCFESFDELGKSILEERSLKQPTPSG